VEGRIAAAPEVRAAGGAVLRTGPGRHVEVVLVHRPGHQDWTLPKGKVERGEKDEECALREVTEETGLECLLGPELGASRYRDRRGRDEGVRYWAMTVRDGTFQPNPEVDEVRWVPLPAAGGQLSYPGDRAVLDALEPALRPLVLLVRHARAGDRAEWTGDDRLRPLDRRGRRQADALVAPVTGYPVMRLVSSPYLRCTQTLQPLATRLGLPVEPDEALAEGVGVGEARALFARLGPGPVVLCTHGDVVEALVGEGQPKKKGSTWLLSRQGGNVRTVCYWSPLA
jgi:8-oxo-dGTP pyrophosphatase MutT (NUDIX family)/phosphohistidine phosphatase SixA